jgi:chorismate--pyruvate lyase
VARGALEFAQPPAGHPLDDLAAGFSGDPGGLPARRCRFELGGAPLVVCEVFLPALEDALPPAARCQVA